MPTILLVDDVSDLTVEIGDALSGPERDVVRCASAHEVQHAMESCDDVDLVVIDRHLRESDALDVLHLARDFSPHAEYIFIAHAMNHESAREAASLGVVEFLVRPTFNAPRLKFLAHNAVERARMRREQSSLLFELQTAELRFELVTRSTHDGVWDWDLSTESAYFSPRFKEMLGYRDDEFGTDIEEWFSRIHPEDVATVRRHLAEHLDGREPLFESEYRMLHRDGSYRWFLARGATHRDEASRVVRMAGSQSDVTKRRRAEEQLLYDAFHDRLTGLPNRSLILDRIDQSIAHAARTTQSVGVAILNIDRFNLVNEGLGFASGDELLKDMAVRLRRALRVTDSLARLGADTFAMVLQNVEGPEQCIAMTQRVRAELAQPFRVGEHEIFATMRMGISLCRDGYRKAEHLLRDAEIAMGRAKSASEGYAFYEDAMQGHSARLLELDARLRRGLQQGEIIPFLQPIVSQPGSRWIGFETLARWQTPDEGILEPASFLPWAERSGLIREINQSVFRKAFETMAQWNRELLNGDPTSLSINVTYEEIREPDFVQRLTELCEETDMALSNLRVEVLENLLVRDPEGTSLKLGALRDLGVKVGLDDFGTGYSSLGYLHRMPVDYLKIDRSFIQAMEGDTRARALVRSILAMATELGLDVVAEGVETKEQHDLLASMDCKVQQGFYYARPMPVEQVEAELIGKKDLRQSA